MSEQVHRLITLDESCLEVSADYYEDLFTHETDAALVVREDGRMCMCLDMATARQLGTLLLKLANQDEADGNAEYDSDPVHARVA